MHVSPMTNPVVYMAIVQKPAKNRMMQNAMKFGANDTAMDNTREPMTVAIRAGCLPTLREIEIQGYPVVAWM